MSDKSATAQRLPQAIGLTSKQQLNPPNGSCQLHRAQEPKAGHEKPGWAGQGRWDDTDWEQAHWESCSAPAHPGSATALAGLTCGSVAHLPTHQLPIHTQSLPGPSHPAVIPC